MMSMVTGPQVGMGATEVMWSDRHAYTIQKVVSPRKVIVTRDRATMRDGCTIYDQEWDLEPTPLEEDGSNGITLVRTTKRWKRLNIDQTFVLGVRREYYDPSF